MPPLTACPNPSSLQRPNLPPHERAHHQIQFGGEICLPRGRSLWMSAYHKQATSRQSRQYPRSTERRRRRTLFLTTAFPTALLTTKPTSGAGPCPATDQQ